MAAAMEWRWKDEVPVELALLRGQCLRTAGLEHWDGWDFIMFDYCDQGTGKFLARYAACPDWRWHWKHQGAMVNAMVNWDWDVDLRSTGRSVKVRQCRWRGRARGTLLHVDDDHPVNLSSGWQLRCFVWGCYVPQEIEA